MKLQNGQVRDNPCNHPYPFFKEGYKRESVGIYFDF